MPNKVNKHGLSRYIPISIKRKIRKNAGFGCVVCGLGICQYDHVDPEFEFAKSHNPKKMTLLCGSCHDKKTRGIYGKNKILGAMKNPKCLEKGFSNDILDIGGKDYKIILGGSVFTKTLSLISVDGRSLFSFLPPEKKYGQSYKDVYKLNLVVASNSNFKDFEIIENEWFGNVNNWDIISEGKKLTIKNSDEKIVLEMTNFPGEKMIVSKLWIQYKGIQFRVEKGAFWIENNKGAIMMRLSKDVMISGPFAMNVINNHLVLNQLLFNGGRVEIGENSFTSNCTFHGLELIQGEIKL